MDLALFCTLSLEIDNYSIEETNLLQSNLPGEKEWLWRYMYVIS